MQCVFDEGGARRARGGNSKITKSFSWVVLEARIGRNRHRLISQQLEENHQTNTLVGNSYLYCNPDFTSSLQRPST